MGHQLAALRAEVAGLRARLAELERQKAGKEKVTMGELAKRAEKQAHKYLPSVPQDRQ